MSLTSFFSPISGGGRRGSTTSSPPPKVYNVDSSWVAGANPRGAIPNPPTYTCNPGTVLTGMNVTMDSPRDVNGKVMKINSLTCTPIDSANRNSHDNSAQVPVEGAGRGLGRFGALSTRTLTCPQSSAVAGLHGEGTSNSITYIKPLCKKADESIAEPRSCNFGDSGCLAARVREIVADSFGRPEPTRTRYVVNCADNNRVTGIAVESGSWVDRVSPLCTPKQDIVSDTNPSGQAPPPPPILTPQNPNSLPTIPEPPVEPNNQPNSPPEKSILTPHNPKLPLEGLSSLHIGGITVGAVVLIVVLVLIIYYARKK